MNKLLIILLSITILTSNNSFGKEGMWIVSLLEEIHDDMSNEGLKLSSDQIYSLNKSSLKDAIVIFGGGCTGEIISKDGLLLTNHHCGYEHIQALSSVDNNHLKNGFWAMNKNEELPSPGLTAKFLIKIEDVTDSVLTALSDTLTEKERKKEIRRISKSIVKRAEKDGEFTATVKSFYNGNQYFLQIYEVYKDVRLVGSPPKTLGKFGGDIDNWMWPRHTCDFSLFRVYTAPDGKPAEYSEDNIPLSPKHYLPISLSGVQEDDYTMIFGFPGSTTRYLSSFGIQERYDISNPAVVKIRTLKLDIMDEHMSSSESIKIKYASKYARSSNYWKFFKGQNKSLHQLKIIDRKKSDEKELTGWINENKERTDKYGNVLTNLESSYNDLKAYTHSYAYYKEAIFQGSEAISFMLKFKGLHRMINKKTKPDQDKLDATIASLRESITEHFKNYDKATDKELFEKMLNLFYKDVENVFHPDFYDNLLEKKFKGDFTKFTDYIYSKSMFVDEESALKFIDKPNAKALSKDPMFIIMNSSYNSLKKIRSDYSASNTELKKNKRLFVDALMKFNTNKLLYPDANQTMRVSYGKVKDYVPGDAVEYNWYTTLSGLIEKDDDSNDFFDVPDKLKELYQNKDYGKYGIDGKLRLCFISDNDITGGSSGSPVINGKGEIIGLAFDGNWEAMSGDIVFEPSIQRTISVDIRYVLFIIDKFAGAGHIVDEMTIVE